MCMYQRMNILNLTLNKPIEHTCNGDYALYKLRIVNNILMADGRVSYTNNKAYQELLEHGYRIREHYLEDKVVIIYNTAGFNTKQLYALQYMFEY